jgi:hypothetical protein
LGDFVGIPQCTLTCIMTFAEAEQGN